MKGKLIFCSLLAIHLHYVHADLIQQFLDAVPLHPTIRPPDVITPELHEEKLEPQTNFVGVFRPLAECSANMTNLKVGDTGTITTPNYPKNYPARADCQWYLESPDDTRIEATIFDLFTQPWFFTYFDYVMISKDGNWSKVDRMAGDMNSRTPMTIISDANKLGIRFRSSTLFNFRGMKIQYLVRPKDEKLAKVHPSPYDGMCGTSFVTEEENMSPTVPPVPGSVSSDTTNTPITIPRAHYPFGPRDSLDLDNHIITPSDSDPAPKHGFPWMAALLIDGRSFCGGSIIDDRHVLTAAHCTDGAKKITVLLGAHDIKMKEEGRLIFNVSRDNIFQHKDYNPNTISHDISVIRLPEKIQFNEKMKPVCLPNRHFLGRTFVGDTVRVSGWGKPSDASPSISPVLKNTTVEVMSNGQCRSFFRSLVTGNLICVATQRDASPCRGDSGGPLMLRQYDAKGTAYLMQVGIVSFGGNSCQRGYPVGFTRVTAFMDYIAKITGGNY